MIVGSTFWALWPGPGILTRTSWTCFASWRPAGSREQQCLSWDLCRMVCEQPAPETGHCHCSLGRAEDTAAWVSVCQVPSALGGVVQETFLAEELICRVGLR